MADWSELPQVEGVKHRYVEVETDAAPVRIHLAEAGSGEPLLLVHGWPQHWYLWRGVIGQLAPHYRLLMPDLRGQGWSATPGRGYDVETFARDQVALLDALGLDRVKLMGHDWGGATSLIAAARNPARFERVIAFNTPHFWLDWSPRLLDQLPRPRWPRASRRRAPTAHSNSWTTRATSSSTRSRSWWPSGHCSSSARDGPPRRVGHLGEGTGGRGSGGLDA